jgi:hypothetical protein
MGKLRHGFFNPLYRAVDTFLRTPGTATPGTPHVRDAIDLKRMMVIVLFALVPCVLAGLWNTGYQANLALVDELGETAAAGWRGAVMSGIGIEADAGSFHSNMIHGALWFLPLYAISFAVGAFWETLFALVRRRSITEGFLVTSLIFPLILPATTPWWQAALGMSFGVVIGKEVFGGVGMNILNPALAGRAFLFFAYPGQMSGDEVWIAADGVTAATPLAEFEEAGEVAAAWMDAFLGVIPGSIGETSTLACLIGACILLATGIASWSHPPFQCRRKRDERNVHHGPPLAFRPRRVRFRNGIHGHRSGDERQDRRGTGRLRSADRTPHRPHPRGEPRLYRGDNAHHPVRQRLRPRHRQGLRRPQHKAEGVEKCGLRAGPGLSPSLSG